MSLQPLTVERVTPANRAGAYLAAAARMRLLPTPRGMARRRWVITLTKWLLPAAALALLTTVAVWPEMERDATQATMAARTVATEVQGGQMVQARYHGVDDRGRPFTLTAAIARQLDPTLIALTSPKGDITLENGTWLMLQSKRGTYVQRQNQLDLRDDVVLYRDDGTTMTTASAAIDLKNGAAAGSDPVHAEGPFGTLDSQGFTVLDKGAIIQFTGSSHVLLNGASPP
jgi:lipopolysaccharide export system protein LptC